MTKSNKLLSICILSYNQVSEIERLLKSIEPQISSEVEVIIRDDSTNNETEILVDEFSKKFPIRYIRGKKEGIDRTVIYLTKEARGEFVWWMGDDVIRPDGITKVLDVIKRNHKVDFIWANYNIFGREELAINFPNSRLFEGIDEILSQDVTGLGFISATIFRKQKALSGLSGAERYVGTLFSNLFIIFHVLSRGGQAYFLRGPIVECHPATPQEIKEIVTKNDGEVDNRGFEVYGVTFRNIINEFSDVFGKKNVRRVLKKSFGSLWRGMLVGWIGGWDNPKGKRWKMFKLYWSYPECWIAVPLMIMPLWLNNALYRIYKIFFSHRRWRFSKKETKSLSI